MGIKKASTNQVKEVLLVEHVEFRDKFFKIFTVEGQPLCFEVDSGVVITVVSIRTLRIHFPNRRPLTTSLELITFCKRPIQIMGVVLIVVPFGATKSNYGIR